MGDRIPTGDRGGGEEEPRLDAPTHRREREPENRERFSEPDPAPHYASVGLVVALPVHWGPVNCTPRMKYRCATPNTRSSGTTAVTAAAIWYGQFVEYSPWNVARPTSTTPMSVDRVAISGQRKLFHWSTNANTASVARAGRDSGSTTRQKIAHSPAPSSRAASSSSRGIVWKT